MRMQGLNSNGEPMSSAYVDRSNSESTDVDFTGTVSMTRQEFADECDVNNVMAQYEKTGILPANMNGNVPQYLDVTGIPDFRASLDFLNEATTAFMALPAVVRKEFDNDPAKFIDYAQDENNLPQMRKWGLAPEELPEPPPQKVEVVNTPPEKPAEKP
jgi:hypothetical protein